MQLHFKNKLTAAVLMAGLAALGASASAQNVGGDQNASPKTMSAGPSAERAMPKQHEQRIKRMEQLRQKHLSALKTALKLSAPQEAAWSTFVADTTHKPSSAMRPLQREDWAKLSTPQRMEKMQALKAERDAQMSKHMEATKRFYAALTPEQQKIFDATTARHHRGMPHQSQHGAGRF